MTLKSYKQRTYLDPIHGPIELHLDDPVENLLTKIIDSKEFQRLRRIRQMGTGWFTFHGAEHSRFGHSIGTLYIATKMIGHLSKRFFEINKYELQILTTALLHDLGHGPFSHTAEKLTGISHESWTKKIITGNTEINSLLKDFDKSLPELIIKVLEYKSCPNYVSQIISSYIDCDRLDYLHRDSYYVGVPYGLTGSERIIASLEINNEDKKMVVNENMGLDAIIHYLQARYSMYQQVYQHKKNIACDFLLKKIIQRMKKNKPENISKSFLEWLNPENYPIEKININSYLQTDDFTLLSIIQNYGNTETKDEVLSDLCNRFINRKLFKSLEFRQEISKDKIQDALEKIKVISETKGFNSEYFAGMEQSATKPYEPYIADSSKTSKAIFIKQKNGLVKELSEVSGLVKALSQENIVKTCLIFTPELEGEINNIKGFHELFK